MTTISGGAGGENGWPARIETIVHKAIGVLMVRDRSTVAEETASLDEIAAATGLDVRAVAAEVVRSTRGVEADEPTRLPSMSSDPELDVEVLVDDNWWPGYLFAVTGADLTRTAGVPGPLHHPLSGRPDGEPGQTLRRGPHPAPHLAVGPAASSTGCRGASNPGVVVGRAGCRGGSSESTIPGSPQPTTRPGSTHGDRPGSTRSSRNDPDGGFSPNGRICQDLRVHVSLWTPGCSIPDPGRLCNAQRRRRRSGGGPAPRGRPHGSGRPPGLRRPHGAARTSIDEAVASLYESAKTMDVDVTRLAATVVSTTSGRARSSRH